MDNVKTVYPPQSLRGVLLYSQHIINPVLTNTEKEYSHFTYSVLLGLLGSARKQNTTKAGARRHMGCTFQ